MSDSTKICPQCGSVLTSDGPGGLCPRCVMAMNLASSTMPEGESVSSDATLSLDEMRERFPQCEILECLGRGGMGIVYRARQKALDREVAIKVLAGEWQGDFGFADRFEAEAKLLAKLNHPNIVTVHDFGESKGLFYIVMEYVDGVNIRDVLRDGKLDAAMASMAKLNLSELQCEVADECVQLHGGYGYIWEYGVARSWADARVQRIYAGTNEIMKELIARKALDS